MTTPIRLGAPPDGMRRDSTHTTGWVACRDPPLAPGATQAPHQQLHPRSERVPRDRRTTAGGSGSATDRSSANIDVVRPFFDDYPESFEFQAPMGGCVSCLPMPRDDGVEAFVVRAVDKLGVLMLPASLYASALCETPANRLRIGMGRVAVPAAVDAGSRHSRTRPRIMIDVSGDRRDQGGRRLAYSSRSPARQADRPPRHQPEPVGCLLQAGLVAHQVRLPGGVAGIVIKSGHRRVAGAAHRRLLPNPSPERNHPTRRHRDWRTRTRPGGGAERPCRPRPRRAGPRPVPTPAASLQERQHRVGGQPRRQAGTPLGTAQRAVDCAWLIRRWMVLPNRHAVA